MKTVFRKHTIDNTSALNELNEIDNSVSVHQWHEQRFAVVIQSIHGLPPELMKGVVKLNSDVYIGNNYNFHS